MDRVFDKNINKFVYTVIFVTVLLSLHVNSEQLEFGERSNSFNLLSHMYSWYVDFLYASPWLSWFQDCSFFLMLLVQLNSVWFGHYDVLWFVSLCASWG